MFYCVKIHHTPEGRERNHATTGAQCGACVAIELKKVSKVDPLTEHRFERASIVVDTVRQGRRVAAASAGLAETDVHATAGRCGHRKKRSTSC